MTLVDSGPLIAIVNANDPSHERCASTMALLTGSLITTWAAFTEATHIAYRDLGWQGQRNLLRIVERERLSVVHIEEQWMPRLIEVMEQYRDRPMDLADATLIVLAENHEYTRIFSLDSDFYIYRLAKGRSLEVIP